MYNRIVLVGNLTRGIELRYTPGGTAVAGTGIATNRKFKAADGTQKEEVCFVDISFFGRSAEIANQYLRKGSRVLVEGRLKYDSWQDQNGNKHSRHSIVVENMTMLGNGSQSHQQTAAPQQQAAPQPQQQPQTPPTVEYRSADDPNDDEIPF